jgi:hypothetical protein
MRIFVWFGIPLFSVLLLAVGIANLHLSSRFAHMAGLTMRELFDRSLAGITLSEQYSGTFLRAVERLQTGLMEIVFSVGFFILWPAALKGMARNARILNSLSKGISNKSVERSGAAPQSLTSDR